MAALLQQGLRLKLRTHEDDVIQPTHLSPSSLGRNRVPVCRANTNLFLIYVKDKSPIAFIRVH